MSPPQVLQAHKSFRKGVWGTGIMPDFVFAVVGKNALDSSIALLFIWHRARPGRKVSPKVLRFYV